MSRRPIDDVFANTLGFRAGLAGGEMALGHFEIGTPKTEHTHPPSGINGLSMNSNLLSVPQSLPLSNLIL